MSLSPDLLIPNLPYSSEDDRTVWILLVSKGTGGVKKCQYTVARLVIRVNYVHKFRKNRAPVHTSHAG